MALQRQFFQSNLKVILPAAFLCPALLQPPFKVPCIRSLGTCARKCQNKGPLLSAHNDPLVPLSTSPGSLPLQCPGCGAFTQASNPDRAGYYSSSRKSIKVYLSQRKAAAESNTFEEIQKNADTALLKDLSLTDTETDSEPVI